jgi:hypothetical protein
LQEDGDYEFLEIYPAEDAVIALDDHGKSVFAPGPEGYVDGAGQ